LASLKKIMDISRIVLTVKVIFIIEDIVLKMKGIGILIGKIFNHRKYRLLNMKYKVDR
jgi:hypothetical protein